MAVSLGIFLYVWNWPKEARLYPQIICVVLFALSVLLFLFPKDTVRKTFSSILAACRENRMVLYQSMLTVAFILLIEPLGFFVVLPVFLLIGQLLMGARGFKRLMLPTVLITAFIYLVFVKGLSIQIPVAFWLE